MLEPRLAQLLAPQVAFEPRKMLIHQLEGSIHYLSFGFAFGVGPLGMHHPVEMLRKSKQ